jgi:hypothetical protein
MRLVTRNVSSNQGVRSGLYRASGYMLEDARVILWGAWRLSVLHWKYSTFRGNLGRAHSYSMPLFSLHTVFCYPVLVA